MLPDFEPMTEDDARRMNPQRLAYIGDTVWDLLIRTSLIYSGRNLHHMHIDAIHSVSAASQACMLQRIESMLTESEHDVLHRGRNSHAKHPAPKNQNQADYQAATGFEALFGYLYLTGQRTRLLELFHAAWDGPISKEHV